MGKYTITRNKNPDGLKLTITIKVESAGDMSLAIQEMRRWANEWKPNTPQIISEKGNV